MKVLLNNDSIGLFFNSATELTGNFVALGSGKNYEYNSGNSTLIDVDPPNPPIDFAWKRVGDAWEVADQSLLDAYAQRKIDEQNAMAKEARAKEYAEFTDVLFFKAQRGEITMQEWLDAVQAVKDKYPYI